MERRPGDFDPDDEESKPYDQEAEPAGQTEGHSTEGLEDARGEDEESGDGTNDNPA